MTQEAIDLLSDYIRIDTTNPPGNESLAADFFKGIFKKEKIDYKTYEASDGRASIRACLSGSGQEKPLILLNHTDVVPATPRTGVLIRFAARSSTVTSAAAERLI